MIKFREWTNLGIILFVQPNRLLGDVWFRLVIFHQWKIEILFSIFTIPGKFLSSPRIRVMQIFTFFNQREGRAPRILLKTKSGKPNYTFCSLKFCSPLLSARTIRLNFLGIENLSNLTSLPTSHPRLAKKSAAWLLSLYVWEIEKSIASSTWKICLITYEIAQGIWTFLWMIRSNIMESTLISTWQELLMLSRSIFKNKINEI